MEWDGRENTIVGHLVLSGLYILYCCIFEYDWAQLLLGLVSIFGFTNWLYGTIAKSPTKKVGKNREDRQYYFRLKQKYYRLKGDIK